MRTLAMVALLCFAILGCKEKEEPLANPPEGEQTQTSTTEQAMGSGDGIGVISPATGGMSPVTGSDSVAGSGGGGVGIAAKEQAKRKAGGSSLDQLDDY
jgi:hypothetical protein